MEPALGVRVVRGPDWEWGDQDGGEGFVGTVAGLEEGGDQVVIQWDTGNRCRYRCGQDGKFDLRVLDSGPSGGAQARDIACDWCQAEGLTGCVWRCGHCLDYHLCSQCYMSGRHSTRHTFFRILASSMAAGSASKNRVWLCGRRDTRKVVVRGVFPGAHVVRGFDWKWRDQDGGVSGCVVGVKGWQNETRRSVVEVQWDGRSRTNVYRLGHKGKVDLKCLRPAEGGFYYPDHLPHLGCVGDSSTGDVEGSEECCMFAAGDVVRVDLDTEVVKLMQDGHGGWNEAMADCIRDVGVVNVVLDSGDVQVRYHNNSLFTFNTQVLAKVDMPFHIPGTVVRVQDDIATVHNLQTIGPGWVDDMALTLGVVGRLTKRLQTGVVQASVNGQRWHYHPQCLLPVSRHLLHNNPDVEDVDKGALMKVFSLMQHCDPRDSFIYVAAAGDVPTLKQCLEKHPDEINRKMRGRTAVHVVCSEGFIGCLKVLLSYHPDLEMLDDNGLRPIHVCAYSNCGEAARLILAHGADIDSKDGRQNTATMAAGALGHYEVLEVLLEHHLLNLHAGDHIGSTALHCAVIAWRCQAVKLLLEAGADPSIPNYTASTPLHDAAAVGNLPSVERMVMYHPQHINLQKCDDSNTPLHVAATANRLDIVSFLAQQSICQLDLPTSQGLTPLHIAAHEGHSAVVEMLVGYGADLNATVEDGNTPLFLVTAQRKMKTLNADTPQLKHVEEALLSLYGSGFQFEPYIVVACMLVQEGADPHIKNKNGESPLQKCPPDLATVVKTFAQKHGEYHGILRSRSTSNSLPTILKKKKVVPPAPSEEAAVPASQSSSFPKDLKRDVPKPVGLSPVHTESGTHTEGAGNTESGTHTEGAGNTEGSGHTEGAGGTQGERGSGQPPPATSGTLVRPGNETTLPDNPEDSDDRLCCLCDRVVNVRLSPCGHTTMCSECAGTAKRCPQCRERIQRTSVLC